MLARERPTLNVSPVALFLPSQQPLFILRDGFARPTSPSATETCASLHDFALSPVSVN